MDWSRYVGSHGSGDQPLDTFRHQCFSGAAKPPGRQAVLLPFAWISMGVWRDSSQPRIEETDAVGNCKQLEKDRLKTGGWRRHEFLCSLDTDRLMGVALAIIET